MQVEVLTQHGILGEPKVTARFEPEVIEQSSAGGGIHLESLDLATGRRERSHRQAPPRFSCGLGAGQGEDPVGVVRGAVPGGEVGPHVLRAQRPMGQSLHSIVPGREVLGDRGSAEIEGSGQLGEGCPGRGHGHRRFRRGGSHGPSRRSGRPDVGVLPEP